MPIVGSPSGPELSAALPIPPDHAQPEHSEPDHSQPYLFSDDKVATMTSTPVRPDSVALPIDPAARAHDPQRFRRILGHYPTGVTVVTAIGADGTPEGMVVGSFTSVSLDPPLVAFLPASNSGSWARLRTAGRFCVNILGADHEQLCRQFAARGGDKYSGVAWTAAPSGSPIIDGAVAWIDCETETVHTAGDHDIVI